MKKEKKLDLNLKKYLIEIDLQFKSNSHIYAQLIDDNKGITFSKFINC